MVMRVVMGIVSNLSAIARALCFVQCGSEINSSSISEYHWPFQYVQFLGEKCSFNVNL